MFSEVDSMREVSAPINPQANHSQESNGRLSSNDRKCCNEGDEEMKSLPLLPNNARMPVDKERTAFPLNDGEEYSLSYWGVPESVYGTILLAPVCCSKLMFLYIFFSM